MVSIARVVKDFKEIKGILVYYPEKLVSEKPEDILIGYYLFKPSKKLILFVDRRSFFSLVDEFVDLYDAGLIEKILLFHENKYAIYEMPKNIRKFRGKLKESIKRMRFISKIFRSLKADCFGIIFSEDFSVSILKKFEQKKGKPLGLIVLSKRGESGILDAEKYIQIKGDCLYAPMSIEDFKKLLTTPLKLKHVESFKKIVKLMKECYKYLEKNGEIGMVLAEILKRLISHLVVNYHKIIADDELQTNFKILLIEVIKTGEKIVEGRK